MATWSNWKKVDVGLHFTLKQIMADWEPLWLDLANFESNILRGLSSNQFISNFIYFKLYWKDENKKRPEWPYLKNPSTNTW